MYTFMGITSLKRCPNQQNHIADTIKPIKLLNCLHEYVTKSKSPSKALKSHVCVSGYSIPASKIYKTFSTLPEK